MIDGRKVMMVCNGATPRIYRQLFGKDLLTALPGAISRGKVIDVELFENLAYIMAKQGGSTTDDVEAWLASFDSPMAIPEAIKENMDLWRLNEKTTVDVKKKAEEQTGQ